MTTALDHAISPADACARLLSAGIKISERTLRERARKIGAYREIGKTMFFLPKDIERILEDAAKGPKECQSSEKSAKRGITNSQSMGYDTDTLLRRLTSGKRKTGQSNTNPASVVPLSTARKPS